MTKHGLFAAAKKLGGVSDMHIEEQEKLGEQLHQEAIDVYQASGLTPFKLIVQRKELKAITWVKDREKNVSRTVHYKASW